ncbi:MAG: C-type lectin domain-containing protein [Ruminococcaceae bacterium]|nr:C-type lectin domain-containing protein [Oscillospiraceae bacterium]
MKKKILPILLCLLLSCALLSSCGFISGLLNDDEPGENKCEHTEVVDASVTPTCTAPGLTEGKHCSACGEVLIAQTELPPLNHQTVIDEAVAQTCTENGLTSGMHCSVCNTVVVAQEVIPASHIYGEWISISEPDCFLDGERQRVCIMCENVDADVIPHLEHKFVQNEETKLYACESCDARILDGHLYAAFNVQVNWYDAYKACDSMGGHLVTITSDREQAVITELAGSRAIPGGVVDYYYWTGALKNSSRWKWITGEEFSYTHWGIQGQDNSANSWHMGITTELVSQMNNKMLLGDWEDLAHHPGVCGFICEWVIDIEESEHFFTEWSTVTEASCFVEGEQYRICTHCGLEESEVIPKIKHSFILNEETGINSCEHCDAALFDGRIYKIFKIQLSWFDAYTYCEKLGGHLATVTSEEEQAFIEQYMISTSPTSKNESAWLGAYDDGDSWKWVTGEEFEYNNWGQGEPNRDGAEYFAHIYPKSGYIWNDIAPSIYNVVNLVAFICEWEYAE